MELSDTDSKRGWQDAITPPWQVNLGLGTFLAFVVIVGLMWWQEGGFAVLGVVAVFFFCFWIAKLFLPKPGGLHYRQLILQSMLSRYANYVRDGDALRAETMKHLLVKAGFNPDEIVNEMFGK